MAERKAEFMIEPEAEIKAELKAEIMAEPKADIGESQLRQAIREVLKNADLQTLSRKLVRKQLEAKFGADLGHQKSFISTAISEIMAEEEEDEEDEEDEEVEEEADGEEDNDIDDKDPAARPSRAKSKRKRATRDANGGKKARTNSGFNKGLLLSPELAEVLGASELPRPQIVKKMWEYIHDHNLQDPKDKRSILLDDRLRQVFDRNSFTMFSMNKFIKRHVRAPDELPPGGWSHVPRDGHSSDDDEEKKAEKERRKQNKLARKKGEKVKRGAPKNPNAGINKSLKLSSELAAFVGASEMSRPQVVKKMWEHIREHELQNPANRQEILCDATLQQLFDGEAKVTMFSMNKALGRHFLKE